MNSFQLNDDFTTALPGDAEASNYPREVYRSIWSKTQPVAAAAPTLASHIEELTSPLGIDVSDPEAARLFTGSSVTKSTTPYALRYGGHQFGSWAGQLGDGRAIALGEVNDINGQHWTLQLKGAGPTPYSRQGDGYAVLRSSIREYMCAEAIHHLGIPTTRSVTLCTTGETIARDVFYDGNITMEQGAIVCRAAHSFIRFGNFEIHAAYDEIDLLKQLADYVITRDYPHLGQPGPDVYQQWFREILNRTAKLVANWQRVGFVHAVMNTDNMSILGQTIDYGPYGWLEEYDPRWTPNYIDHNMRRYAYGNQPEIAVWNLYRLANAILPLFETTEPLEEVLKEYHSTYDEIWNTIQANKIGLPKYNPQDRDLYESLWTTLKITPTDYTIFFRQLAKITPDMQDGEIIAHLKPALYKPEEFKGDIATGFTKWITQWQSRVAKEDQDKRIETMQQTNPKYVLRNYLALNAIDAAETGDFSLMEDIMKVLRTPYDEQPEAEQFAARRPDWATKKPGCTMLTCSS